MARRPFVSVSDQFRVARQQTAAETQRLIAAVARREHRRVMDMDPKPAAFTRFVDGKRGAREEEVRPDGVIVYEYPRLDLAVQYAMEVLFDKSPVYTGTYRVSHTILLNGQPVPNLKDWKRGDRVLITNPVPYARKIEIGKMRMRVPGTDHVYEQATQIVAARYGNLARVGFTYISAQLPYIRMGNRAASRAAGRAKRSAAAIERATRMPALQFSERS